MRWISSIGGVIATGAAALVLISLPTAPQVVAEPVAPPIEVGPAVEPIEQVFVEEHPQAPDLDVPELGVGIADVLAEGGYTQFVGTGELAETLPDEVVQVLIKEEAVLVIPADKELK